MEWDTFEQICVWQLLNSEEPPVLSVVGLLPDLHKSGIVSTVNVSMNYSLCPDHPEALANTLLYTKRAVYVRVDCNMLCIIN